MKKVFILFFAAGVSAALFSAELVIADGKTSAYQIVVPESSGNKRLDHFVTLGGKVLRTAVRKASGAELPLVTETKKIPGKPAIFVGNTGALKKAGLSCKDLAPWEYVIKTVGKDIYIYGRDYPAPLKNQNIHRFLYYTLGSLKGCCTFAEKFLNTRFVAPELNSDQEYDGVRTLPCNKITVPEKFMMRRKPRFVLSGDNGGVLYTVANNFMTGTGNRFDVHYIDKVISVAKYAKTHPEYFALIDGKRYLRADMPQYCMSNPDVQKIVFQDALRRADLGYPVVELGQQDGFMGCECAPCKAWQGTSDWGEKMWRFQREIMEKLQKLRPGIQVGIACYGVTHCVPKTFKKFPGEGAFINIAPARKDLLEKWKHFNVTGMNAWGYNMGPYLACGYSPADSFKKLQKEIKFLYTTPVSSFYLCQYICSYAINGPWLYAWGKFMENPDADAKVLLKDYCRFAFGEKAAPGFFRFFSIIDRQMEKFPLKDGQDFNDVDGVKKRQSSLKLWQDRYPEKVLKELCRLFDESIKLCDPGNKMLLRLKVEFEYLKLSAAVCNAIKAMDLNNSNANRKLLADALEKRNAFIDSLPLDKRGKIADGFVYTGREMLRKGGYMAGVFGGAFGSDPKLLRLNVPETTAVKVRDLDDPAWENAPRLKLHPMKSGNKNIAANFRIGYTEKALLMKFEAPIGILTHRKLERDDLKLWDNSIWEVFIADGDRRRQFAFTALRGSAFDTLIYANGLYNKRWNTAWSHQDKIKDGVWYSQLTIPFASFGRVLEPGMRLQMQIAFSTPGAKELYAWYIPLSGAFSDIKGFGGVRFGKRAAEKKIELNGNFKELDQKKRPLFWKNGRVDMQLLPGKNGNTIRISGNIKQIGSLYCTKKIWVEPDEKLEVTFRLRGKGAVSIAAQWRNNAGMWVENDGTPWKNLKQQTMEIRHTFTPSHRVQKGAAYLTLSLYLRQPGGNVTVESVSACRKKSAK
ncbi:MAG: DUF4838 domain-containing protein [Lentisphaerae bacterium]|nr:DUF4838 domain-containing protein [Lentisphaerota bacterium]